MTYKWFYLLFVCPYFNGCFPAANHHFSFILRLFFRPYDTKLKMRGLKFKRASVSELKTELEVWEAHEKFSVEKASRLA